MPLEFETDHPHRGGLILVVFFVALGVIIYVNW